MTPTILIGDIHADFAAAKRLIAREEASAGRRLPSVQIGDYGFGHWSPAERREVGMFHARNPRHRFLRGNHDRLEDAQDCAGFLPDGTVTGGILFLGGADGAFPGIGDTETGQDEMNQILRDLKQAQSRPSVIVSHDGPQAIAQRIAAELAHASTGSTPVSNSLIAGELPASRTRAFLTEVFAIVQPRLWIFGHWHHAWAHEEGNTHFRAMGFQEAFTVSLPWLETE
jgi:hypothetical protein